MDFSFGLDIDVRCVGCGAERELPEPPARRVLMGRVIYADVDEPCQECGSTRLSAEVTIDDGTST